MELIGTYRTLGIIILVNALLLQTFPKTLVLADYYFNTETYAAYCINKDKREMHCNGQCQLDKKMHKMGHRQHDQNGKKELVVPVYLAPEMIVFNAVNTSSNQKEIPSYFPNFYIQNQTSGLFRPPQLLF